VDLKDLRYFRIIVECGTFSKAAAHLRVAQPALSRKIQKLEHSLGVQLLKRSARGVIPTEAGRAMLQRSAKFETELDEMRREIARYAEHTTGVVRVAFQAPLSLIMAPILLKEYRAAYPDVVLELTEGFSGDLIDGLLNERIDLAIADMPSHSHTGLNSCQLWVETLQLVGPGGGHVTALFGPGPLPLRDLADVPIIMPSRRYAIRRLVDAAFERQHLKCKPAIEANGAMMILQLVKAGFGYTLMPSNSVYPWTASGELEAISVRPVIRRTMSVVTRTVLLDDPRVASLRTLVRALAPTVANKERFGPAALYLGERDATRPAMPGRHGEQAVKALVA